jgi:D-tyrosyl-tRNA(Tyr) deacylase
MRAVIQRVSNASVAVDGQCVGSIDIGFLILLGVTHEDTEQDANWLASKVTQLRIFSDDEGKMNLDLSQVGGRILVISQFTLFAETKKGNRPSFIKAAGADKANGLYTYFSDLLEQLLNQPVERGVLEPI